MGKIAKPCVYRRLTNSDMRLARKPANTVFFYIFEP